MNGTPHLMPNTASVEEWWRLARTLSPCRPLSDPDGIDGHCGYCLNCERQKRIAYTLANVRRVAFAAGLTRAAEIAGASPVSRSAPATAMRIVQRLSAALKETI